MTGLCSINMNGEVVKLRFALPALQYLIKNSQKPYLKMVFDEGLVNETALPYVIYAGYLNHCFAEEREPVKTLSDFMEWAELNSDDPEVKEDIHKSLVCFGESRYIEKFAKRINDEIEDLKKKNKELTGTTSSPSVMES